MAPLTPVAIAQTTKEETTKKTIVTEVKVAPEPGTLAATINDSATFSILAKALKAADLEGMLGDPKGSYTIFAPTDDAFMPYLFRDAVNWATATKQRWQALSVVGLIYGIAVLACAQMFWKGH